MSLQSKIAEGAQEKRSAFQQSVLPDLVAALRDIVADDGIILDETSLKAFECDGLTALTQIPPIVVLPETTRQVADVVKACTDRGIKIVPRGAGTGLSGGALPLADGVLLGLTKMNRILEMDYENRCAVVQPGVTNLAISQAATDQGFYYAPDPSSQIACTIGGNVAENSGGVHCLKYGVTVNNVLGLEVVLFDGTVLKLGGKFDGQAGYDLLGAMTGSEGLLGIVTEVTVRLLKKPTTQLAVMFGFPSVEEAGRCVGDIISAGVIPAGIEMMDKLAIEAAEAFCQVGYPLDVEALLIVEVDGPMSECDAGLERITEIADTRGATYRRTSASDEDRLKIWAGRKATFPAVGRLSPDYYCMDGTIPRGQLPYVLRRMSEMSKHYGLAVANVFHAGDGNLHPLVLYDADKPGELEKAEDFGTDILKLCVDVGGVLTGEHGVGIEKQGVMTHMFDKSDLDHQQRLKCAFDPHGLLNPGKVFPTLHRCAELGRVHVHGGALRFPDLPRF